MTVVRACGASFSRDGDEIVAPFDLVAGRGDVALIAQPTAFAASIAARICAGIVKPTTGNVFVGDFETRLQPPQAKRLVGFVDAAGFDGDDHAFRCETAFRADVWAVDAHAAHVRAQAVFTAVAGGDEMQRRYARALALALVPDVAALVLDQPARRILDRVRAFAPGVAIVRSHVSIVAVRDAVPEREPVAS